MSTEPHPPIPVLADTERPPRRDFAIPQLGEGTMLTESLSEELAINQALPGLEFREPTAMILDLNNLYKRAAKHGLKVDYSKLFTLLKNRCDLRYAAGFLAIDHSDDRTQNWVKYMQRSGYAMFIKDLKFHSVEGGGTVTKGNVDVNITIEALKLHQAFSHVILATCDGDFVPLVEALQEGSFRKVSVLGINDNMGRGTSRELIRAVEQSRSGIRTGHFYDLNRLRPYIEQEPRR